MTSWQPTVARGKCVFPNWLVSELLAVARWNRLQRGCYTKNLLVLYLVAICSLLSNTEKTPTVQAVVEHKLEMQAVCLQSKSCNFYSECKYSSFPAYVLLVATFLCSITAWHVVCRQVSIETSWPWQPGSNQSNHLKSSRHPPSIQPVWKLEYPKRTCGEQARSTINLFASKLAIACPAILQ